MRIRPGAWVWSRRAILAVVLVGAAVIPSRAVSQQTQHCTGPRCRPAGSILWADGLAGSWLAEPGVAGTVPSLDSAYAATGGGLAVLGLGLRVTAFSLDTGRQAWQAVLTGLPDGSVIAGVRAFDSVVAVGVQPPPGATPQRDEVILSAVNGQQLRSYPAAAYGGAIAGNADSTVIVGPSAVTAYANATGRVLWSRAAAAGQTWRVSGQYAYVTQSGTSASVTAVRRISLGTGAAVVLRASCPGTGSTARGAGACAFPGTLSAVVDGVMLFSASSGIVAYDGETGAMLWQRGSSLVELADPDAGVAYLASGAALDGVAVASGTVVNRATLSVAGSLYWVAGGVALGLDQNGLGDAWGYDLGTRRVLWTSDALPWPHFFVDPSGLGGSVSPGSTVAVLATCARVGPRKVAAAAPVCLKPQLTAVRV